MADVRSLLQRERDSRRLQHPHLSYSKSGVLTCNVCHLNVKSEALWDGHLKSANHKNNAQKAKDVEVGLGRGTKRKIDDLPEAENLPVDRGEGRKKTKSAQLAAEPEPVAPAEKNEGLLEGFVPAKEADKTVAQRAGLPDRPDGQKPPEPVPLAVDEDEWAAFEREVVPFAQPNVVADYSNATISAAPMTAAEAAAQVESERRSKRDVEADDEVEEEQRRMEDEFEVMEEMEERVKRLKEKREALRHGIPPRANDREDRRGPAPEPEHEEQQREAADEKVEEEDKNDDGEEDEIDDWFS